jgi:hypothetical protein
MSTFNDDPAKDFEDSTLPHLQFDDAALTAHYGQLHGAWMHLENTHSLYEDKFVTKPNLTLAQNRFEGAMKALEQTAMTQRFRLLALIISAASKFRNTWQKLQVENERLRMQLQNAQDDPSVLAEVPLLLPFTPDSKPPNQMVLIEFDQFSHMLLDGDSSDASTDATVADDL